ncbi:rhodanese-like domain-containing protein [Kaistella flava (ex Peng et al. 2021)]|uniref:Rhodanese-like domain-containing protein n=1 Tax=Kaistella flava (ex Peng et al. 2021) TaxID=2038776 RepID=A0A7M2YAE9_9FLAO|nr:rhodanese-like domain-containing protein [Kaistella flava (ex Peng et al. 2021)]QOW11248.1 rhodanese-like domain-containing protein [Kaistella flava (ex Peng et al. 2021)]
MFDFIKKLFGSKSVDFKELFIAGAQIIDVRTPAEFSNGHIKQSKNIPLQQLQSEMKKLDLKKPIITCCASGMRSASAKSILQQNGFEVYNGGGWSSLQSKLNK